MGGGVTTRFLSASTPSEYHPNAPASAPRRDGGRTAVPDRHSGLRFERKEPGSDLLDTCSWQSTTVEALAKLPTPFRQGGTVTAGNASGDNDGAAALIVASETAVRKYGLTPIARILGGAAAGVEPRIMGIGPAPATQKLCARLGLTPQQFDIVELNEAFASQGIAVLRQLGVAEDAGHVNPNGGAIALGHPLGMSGARISGTAALELRERGRRYALATMCIGVRQGIAVAIELA